MSIRQVLVTLCCNNYELYPTHHYKIFLLHLYFHTSVKKKETKTLKLLGYKHLSSFEIQ